MKHRLVELGMDFKVILTNHTLCAGKVVTLHEGLGGQEKVFGELKTRDQLGYGPYKKLPGNQMWLLSSVLKHTLSRELQMASGPCTPDFGCEAHGALEISSAGDASADPYSLRWAANTSTRSLDADSARDSGDQSGL